jgi:hypothetical protein
MNERQASAKINVAAMYFEMNGFTINPDRWYFDGFAYETVGDIWELDWLAHWDADTDDDQFTLTGMESVQEAFASCYCDEDQPLSVKMAAELANHLVNARFMQLIAATHGAAKRKYKALDALPVLSPAIQVLCHAYGYTPIEKDFRDMELLQERFGVELPPQLRPNKAEPYPSSNGGLALSLSFYIRQKNELSRANDSEGNRAHSDQSAKASRCRPGWGERRWKNDNC